MTTSDDSYPSAWTPRGAPQAASPAAPIEPIEPIMLAIDAFIASLSDSARSSNAPADADIPQPLRRPISPSTADAATRRGWHRRDVRRPSSNSCDPAPRPFPTSARQHGAAAHKGQNAARSDRSPPRTPSTTDQRLRYEPRRPRRIQLSSQTPNDAAVTAPTSADTPKRRTSRSTAAVLAVAARRGIAGEVGHRHHRGPARGLTGAEHLTLVQRFDVGQRDESEI
jgi:hypothetical protein